RMPVQQPMPAPPALVATSQVGYVRPVVAAELNGPAGDPLVNQATTLLHDSIYPSEREWAIERLATCDWRQDERILAALRTSAREDPAPTVRCTCLQALARMKVRTAEVLDVVRGLTVDPDERVRKE